MVFDSDNSFKKWAVPERAIVPRLDTRSFLFIPIPLSEIDIKLLFLSIAICILKFGSSLINFSLVLAKYLSLSHASEALETSSLTNTSFSE